MTLMTIESRRGVARSSRPVDPAAYFPMESDHNSRQLGGDGGAPDSDEKGCHAFMQWLDDYYSTPDAMGEEFWKQYRKTAVDLGVQIGEDDDDVSAR